MTAINYEGRRFKMLGSSTGDAAAVASTLFEYHQTGSTVYGTYAGGSVIMGGLLGAVDADGNLTIRFHHQYTDGRLVSGEGTSRLEILDDGRYRLHETYRFYDTGYEGTSSVEEVR